MRTIWTMLTMLLVACPGPAPEEGLPGQVRSASECLLTEPVETDDCHGVLTDEGGLLIATKNYRDDLPQDVGAGGLVLYFRHTPQMGVHALNPDPLNVTVVVGGCANDATGLPGTVTLEGDLVPGGFIEFTVEGTLTCLEPERTQTVRFTGQATL